MFSRQGVQACVCWCLCVYERSSHKGPGSAWMPKEWYVFTLRGRNKGFRHRAPTRAGIQRAQKHAAHYTKCRSVCVCVYV